MLCYNPPIKPGKEIKEMVGTKAKAKAEAPALVLVFHSIFRFVSGRHLSYISIAHGVSGIHDIGIRIRFDMDASRLGSGLWPVSEA